MFSRTLSQKETRKNTFMSRYHVPARICSIRVIDLYRPEWSVVAFVNVQIRLDEQTKFVSKFIWQFFCKDSERRKI